MKKKGIRGKNQNATKLPQQQQQSLIIPLCEFGYMDHMTLLDSVKKDRILNQSNTTNQNK